MDAPALTVRAKFLTNPKSAGAPGVLMLNWDKFLWVSNDPEAAPNIDVQFKTIKGHRASKETPKFKKALLNMCTDAEMKEGYMFEFDNFRDRDACRNLVAQILGKCQGDTGGTQAGNAGDAQKKPSTSEAANQKEHFIRKEMDRRMRLLSEDRELQKLHQQLVMNGVLTENEFWAARKNVLDDENLRAQKQKTGLKSAMLADVRPMHDGRTNKVTFNLTPEIIHQIFAEKPAVHRAFLMYVPKKITEVEFWTKYCRAELINRTKVAAAVAGEAEEDEYLAMFLKDDDIIASESQRKIRKVDPTLDMTADLADDYLSLPGHGILRDGSKEDVRDDATQVKKTLLHDINRHAAVVLDSRPLDTELRDTTTVAYALIKAKEGETTSEEDANVLEQRRLERVREMTKVDDLEGSHAPAFVPLCIQDPRSYFDLQQPSASETSISATSRSMSLPSMRPHEVLSSFRQQLSDFHTTSLQDPVIFPEIASRVLNELTKYISNRNMQLGRNAEKGVLDTLPQKERQDFLELSATSYELLRHFWAAYPLTSTFLRDKASRIKGAMMQIYNKVQALKDSARAEFRHPLSLLVKPLIQALDAAFTHYDMEEKRVVRPPVKVSEVAMNGVRAVG